MTPPIANLPAGAEFTDRTINIGGQSIDVHIPVSDSVELADSLYDNWGDNQDAPTRPNSYERHSVFIDGSWTTAYMTDSDYSAYSAAYLSASPQARSDSSLFPPSAHAGREAQPPIPFRPLSGSQSGAVGLHYIRLDSTDAGGIPIHINGVGTTDSAQIGLLRNSGYVEVGQFTNNHGELVTVFASPLDAQRNPVMPD